MEKLLYEFLEHAKRKKYKSETVDDYRRTLRAFLLFIGEEYPDITEISEVSRDMVLSYEKHLAASKDSRDKVLSRNRRTRYLLNLRTFFRYLEREEKIFKNPAVNIALPKMKQRLIRNVLSADELGRLFNSCSGSTVKSLRDRAIMELVYSSGIRADELCNIVVKDIDFCEDLLFVRKGKWGSERIIPFGQSAHYWVNRYLERSRNLICEEDSDLLFVSIRGKKLHPQAIRRMIKFYAGRAGLDKNVTTHALRHTCAIHMLKGNADIRYVQKQLGHRNIATTEKYLKIDITDLKEVHERCHPREQEDW